MQSRFRASTPNLTVIDESERSDLATGISVQPTAIFGAETSTAPTSTGLSAALSPISNRPLLNVETAPKFTPLPLPIMHNLDTQRGPLGNSQVPITQENIVEETLAAMPTPTRPSLQNIATQQVILNEIRGASDAFREGLYTGMERETHRRDSLRPTEGPRVQTQAASNAPGQPTPLDSVSEAPLSRLNRDNSLNLQSFNLNDALNRGGTMSFKEAIKFLKPYSGNKSTVHFFVKAADRAFQLCKPEDHGCLFIYILNGLEEKEQTAIGNREFQSYSELRSFLTGKFTNPGETNLIKISSKFSTLKQGVSEEPIKYFDRAIAMRRKIDEIANNSGAGQTQVIDAAHRELITCFIQGLRSSVVRSRLYESRPVSLEAVLEDLENWEEFNQGSEEVSRFSNPMRILKENSPQPNPGCSLCFDKQHSLRNCPELTKLIQDINMSNNVNNSRGPNYPNNNWQRNNNRYSPYGNNRPWQNPQNRAPYDQFNNRPMQNQHDRAQYNQFNRNYGNNPNPNYFNRNQHSFSSRDQRNATSPRNGNSHPQPRGSYNNPPNNTTPALTQGEVGQTNNQHNGTNLPRNRHLNGNSPLSMWFYLNTPEGKGVRVLYDTGASISVISRSAAYELGHDFIACDEIPLTGLGNQQVRNYGSFPFTFYADKTPIFGNFRIIDDESVVEYHVFFGMDLCLKYKPQIDWINQSLRFGDSGIPFFITPDSPFRQTPEPIRCTRAMNEDEIPFEISTVARPGNAFPDVQPTHSPPQSQEASDLSDFRQRVSQTIVDDFPAVFGPLPKQASDQLIPLEINLKTDKDFPRIKSYRLAPHLEEFVRKEINELLEKGVIRRGSTGYNSPIWVVPKKPDVDGSPQYRMVMDFRRLNEMTVFESYPLPRIDQILDRLGKAKYFSKLDLLAGYHQIPICIEDQHKTGFQAMGESFYYVRTPFGALNSAQNFQRNMNRVLHGLIGYCCYVYLDDVIIFGRSRDEHLANLRLVFDRFDQYNLRVKLSKCEFFAESLEFLGHRITTNGFGMNLEKVDALKTLNRPTNAKKLRSFLGMANFYRRFIPNYSIIAAPLFHLLKKKVPYVWRTEQDDAFVGLLQAIERDALLAYPDYSKTFHVTTDACLYGMGAVLHQEAPDGIQRPIAFISTKLKDAEQRYSTIERECLAIVWAIKSLRHYLVGKEFVVHCDHCLLIWLKNNVDSASRLFRWNVLLSEYRFQIKYKPGKENVVADELSRNVGDVIEPNPDDEDMEPPTNIEDVLPDLQTILILRSGKTRESADSQSAEPMILSVDEQVELVDAMLPSDDYNNNIPLPAIVEGTEEANVYSEELTDSDDNEALDRWKKEKRELVSDEELIDKIIAEHHGAIWNGHRGITATIHAINMYLKIPNLQKRVTEFISRC